MNDHVRPDFLVSTKWLQTHLNDPNVKVLDCTVYLRPTDEGMVKPVSGYEDWRKAHIPGSVYADLLQDLSDKNSSLPVMLPPAQQFEEAMSGYGVSNASRVVLYDTAENLWAARVWWMLAAFGFHNAALLDGGFRKWQKEGRPVTDELTTPVRGQFSAHPEPVRVTSKAEVLDALNKEGICLLNGLSASEFSGDTCRVSRPGRIPGSHNVPAGSLLDPDSNTFLPADILQARFEATGAMSCPEVITYCGGGIAASALAFALALAGREDVRVYDGSLVEWSADPALPMETGPQRP